MTVRATRPDDREAYSGCCAALKPVFSPFAWPPRLFKQEYGAVHNALLSDPLRSSLLRHRRHHCLHTMPRLWFSVLAGDDGSRSWCRCSRSPGQSSSPAVGSSNKEDQVLPQQPHLLLVPPADRAADEAVASTWSRLISTWLGLEALGRQDSVEQHGRLQHYKSKGYDFLHNACQPGNFERTKCLFLSEKVHITALHFLGHQGGG